MKKLATILISSFLIISCEMVKQEDIVTSVQEFKKGKYAVETTSYYFNTDSIYNVGDTLKISK